MILKGNGTIFYGQEPHSGDLLPQLWGQLSTTCSNAPEVKNRQLPVAVDLSQLLSMASETGDPIVCQLSPTL